MTSVSVRISQSELFPAVMSTLHTLHKCVPAVVFNFVRVSENICTIYLENFHTEYGKCIATVRLFAKTFNKEVSNVSCEKPIIIVELLLELRVAGIVVIQDSEDGKRIACKKCARKIVNCYRMFAELQEALAGGRDSTKPKDL